MKKKRDVLHQVINNYHPIATEKILFLCRRELVSSYPLDYPMELLITLY